MSPLPSRPGLKVPRGLKSKPQQEIWVRTPLTLATAGDRFQKQLQPTLKEAKLALDSAKRAFRKRDKWLYVTIYVVAFFSMCAFFTGLMVVARPPPGISWLPGGAVLALVLGVLLTVLSHCLVWAWVSDEKALQHVHNLELFICEITEIMFPKRHHVAVVDPFEKKVAEYPERLMKIIGNDPVHSGA